VRPFGGKGPSGSVITRPSLLQESDELIYPRRSDLNLESKGLLFSPIRNLPSFLSYEMLPQEIGFLTEIDISIANGLRAIEIAIPDPASYGEVTRPSMKWTLLQERHLTHLPSFV